MSSLFPVDSVTIRRVRGSSIEHPSFIVRIRARELLIHLDEPYAAGIQRLTHTMRVGCLFPRHLFCDVGHVTLRLFRSGKWTFSVRDAVDDLLHKLERLCPNAMSFTLDGCGSHHNREAARFPGRQDAAVVGYVHGRACV